MAQNSVYNKYHLLSPLSSLQSHHTMKLQRQTRIPAISAINNEFHLSESRSSSQGASELKIQGEEFITKLLDRRWSLFSPVTQIHQIMLSATKKTGHEGGIFDTISFLNNTCPSLGDDNMTLTEKDDQEQSFYVLRDDLLHPLVNGNKARKLDALLPLVQDFEVTDMVTCGGCQSAHVAAVAVACAERGIKSHLLLRGEQPDILTGYNLVSTMYGNIRYIPRSLYSRREKLLKTHADVLAGNSGSVVWASDILEASGKLNFEPINAHRTAEKFARKVVIVNEGAGDAVALLGVVRLVQYLSQAHLLGSERALNIVVDAGTGTTAIGLGLAAICLGLPWKVTAVMLADTIDGYREQEKRLISEFKRCCALHLTDHALDKVDSGIVHWVERSHPRKFGNILKGEVEACQQIARQTGILVDPVYTLAAWELATGLSQKDTKEGAKVVMLHTGGTLGMFGLAQRYNKSYFHTL